MFQGAPELGSAEPSSRNSSSFARLGKNVLDFPKCSFPDCANSRNNHTEPYLQILILLDLEDKVDYNVQVAHFIFGQKKLLAA